MERGQQTEPKKRTKLHGFEKHIVSNFLKDRHPYLEGPFKNRYDPTKVYHAVFDRSIPKLVEILGGDDNLDASEYRQAFMLLNEMASHQENKDKMISYYLVYTCLNFMRHEDSEVRREATGLLGSLLSVKIGRNCLESEEIEQDKDEENSLMGSIQEILLEDELKCREVCGWMLCRLTSGRDGVNILIEKYPKIIKCLIKSFKKYTNTQTDIEAQFLIYLLEAMTYILQYDEGIEHFLGTGIMKRFNEILLREDKPYDKHDIRIRYLCLACISLITVNEEGKDESIGLEIIHSANNYLNDKNNDIVLNAVRVIMFSAIHLKGKSQSTNPKDDIIIKNLIDLLYHENEDIVTNVRHTLVNIADLPKGFKLIVKYLSKYVEHLDSIFGSTSIIPLFSLLFKVDRPAFLEDEKADRYKRYSLCISHFINHEDHQNEALQYAIEKTCRIVQRMLPTLVDNSDSLEQEQIAQAIIKICEQDEVNRLALKLFYDKHREIKSEKFNTTFLVEFEKFNGLQEILKKAEEEQVTKFE